MSIKCPYVVNRRPQISSYGLVYAAYNEVGRVTPWTHPKWAQHPLLFFKILFREMIYDVSLPVRVSICMEINIQLHFVLYGDFASKVFANISSLYKMLPNFINANLLLARDYLCYHCLYEPFTCMEVLTEYSMKLFGPSFILQCLHIIMASQITSNSIVVRWHR